MFRNITRILISLATKKISISSLEWTRIKIHLTTNIKSVMLNGFIRVYIIFLCLSFCFRHEKRVDGTRLLVKWRYYKKRHKLCILQASVHDPRSELPLPPNPLLICSLTLLIHVEQYNEWQLFVSTAVYKQIPDIRKCIRFNSI